MNKTIDIRTLPDNRPFDLEFVNFQEEPEYIGPHRHEYYEVFWTLSGEGKHSIDFVEYPLIPGRIYLIAPGQVHEGLNMPEEMFALSFNPDFVSPDYRSQLAVDRIFYQSNVALPFVEADDNGQSELQQLLDIMLRENSSDAPDMEMISALLTGFLRYLMRYKSQPGETQPRADSRMVKLLEMIEANFRTEKETGFYAEQLSLSAKRVNELTRQYFSKTVTRLIHDRIMLEAKRDLAYTEKTIKVVAFDLGMDDVTYFSRFFRRIQGESPKTFRERFRSR